MFNAIFEHKLNLRFDHRLYGLKPKHRFDEQQPVVNGDLPDAIVSGTVKIKPNVRRIMATSVEFEDGSVVNNIDVIIYATGYVFGFPFVQHAAFNVIENHTKLYKYVFAPDIRPSTLAVIGCVQPLGSIIPASEIQCRWAVRVFKVKRTCTCSLSLTYYKLWMQASTSWHCDRCLGQLICYSFAADTRPLSYACWVPTYPNLNLATWVLIY